MRTLIIATNNQGKVREIKSIFAGVYDEVLSLKEANICCHTVEDGATFYENARKKALEASLLTGFDVLADDSGLCVDALNGAPGVYSARYAGDNATDGENNSKLLDDMKHVADGQRSARFVCSVVLARAGKEIARADGRVEGDIAFAPMGEHGFGYDPVFIAKEYGQSFAQLPEDAKNRISHRARALWALKDKIK